MMSQSNASNKNLHGLECIFFGVQRSKLGARAKIAALVRNSVSSRHIMSLYRSHGT